ncbi:MAG: glycosyltransferase [Thermoproteus sp.]|nr:glycosyltransferase [Thermoproteus sp.]
MLRIIPSPEFQLSHLITAEDIIHTAELIGVAHVVDSQLGEGVNLVTDSLDPKISRTLFSYDLCSHNVYIYGTIEGVIPKEKQSPKIKCVKVVAASNESARRAKESGYDVVGVVYHAVNDVHLYLAKQLSYLYINDLPKDLFKIIVVSSGTVRKCMDRMIEAVSSLSERIKRKIFMTIVTMDMEIGWKIKDVPTQLAPMGIFPHTHLMALMSLHDLLLHPSCSEGFGLAVAEANALGVPAIHGDYPPLSNEVGPHNLMFKTTPGRLETAYTDQVYEMYYYDPKDMAELIEYAVENPEAMSELRYKVSETWGKKFCLMCTYPNLLKIVKTV